MMMSITIFCRFESRTAIAKIVSLQDLRFFKQADRPVNRRKTDPIINGSRTLVQLLCVGVILCSR